MAYLLTDALGGQIAPLLLGQEGGKGGRRRHNRRFVEVVITAGAQRLPLAGLCLQLSSVGCPLLAIVHPTAPEAQKNSTLAYGVLRSQKDPIIIRFSLLPARGKSAKGRPQRPQPQGVELSGYTLAGLVSFLFLFALLTGLLLHWHKLVSNFFTFRPWSKWKTVWTDLHTTLGVIQFPLQLLFAITGIVLILNSVLLAPFAKFAYKGDTEKLRNELYASDTTKYAYSYTPLAGAFDPGGFMQRAHHRWPNSRLTQVPVRNYQDADRHVVVLATPQAATSFAGSGKLVYRVRDQRVLAEQVPTVHATYVDSVRAVVYHLHFGDFGGRALRVMYFALGLLGCVVISSGILIWLVARDKPATPERERRFNFWTANVFLAICLSMLPVTAFTMLALLFLTHPTQADIYHWYFYPWLALGSYFVARKNLAVTNKQTLWLSVALCLLVPVLGGAVRGHWFWRTVRRGPVRYVARRFTLPGPFYRQQPRVT